jgi:DNA replication and repair protein RecF
LKLNRISLQGYRNYDNLELNTPESVILFVGPNAQGKTNLLEAIYVLTLTKSHRTSKDKELIGWGFQAAHLSAEMERRIGHCRLELAISQSGKKAKLNGLEQKKLSSYIGTLNAVLFAPEDLEIVKGAPGIRRRFLDMEIAQVEPTYLYDLQQYNKALQHRNHLLRDGAANKLGVLEVWDHQLADFGSKITIKRQQFVHKLQKWAEQIHSGITNGKEHLQIRYVPAIEIEEEQQHSILFERFMLKLKDMKAQELRRGITLVGPHRDDLQFDINGKNAQSFGSQGQQRTTALSIKLAEIELIHEEVGEYPLLLLDDVLSELDQARQTQLIETFQGKVQTFITTTGVESIDLAKLPQAAIYRVNQGTVTKDGE